MTTSSRAAWFRDAFTLLADNVETVIQGKRPAIELALVCLCAEGHLLLEDVPGVGKTQMARAIAGSISGTWKRIQFTPDLLPSDVTGVSIFNQKSLEFEFKPGPVFANVVIGDEINRASPKTQSALLEVMEEQRVTVDAVAHPVPRPFVVIATQNPIDLDGTYKLPEAQLDRFLLRTRIGYPDHGAEVGILQSRKLGTPIDALEPVMGLNDMQTMVDVASEVHVDPSIQGYIVSLAEATRGDADTRLGASPRASLGLMRASSAWAASQGRDFVTPEDIKVLAEPVFAHRLVLTPEAELHGRTAEQVVGRALAAVPVAASTAGRLVRS